MVRTETLKKSNSTRNEKSNLPSTVNPFSLSAKKKTCTRTESNNSTGKRKISEVKSQQPQQRVDRRRKIEPEKDHPIDKIMKRRIRDSKKKLPDGKTQELVLIEYLVRWSGYDSKSDTWVRKDSISPVAVREYESGKQDFGKDTPGQILAKVPAGLHPSHVAYKSAQEMALWSSAVTSLHAGRLRRIHHRDKAAQRRDETCYDIYMQRFDSLAATSSSWEVGMIVRLCHAVEELAQDNGVPVTVRADHEPVGRAMQPAGDGWSCGRYPGLLYDQALSSQSKLVEAWSNLQRMNSGVRQRRINQLTTMGHDHREDEVSMNKEWFSGSDIENTIDAIGLRHEVTCVQGRPKNLWEKPARSVLQLESHDPIHVSDDEGGGVEVRYYRDDHTGVRAMRVFSYTKDPNEDAFEAAASALLSSLFHLGPKSLRKDRVKLCEVLMVMNSSPAERAFRGGGTHWVTWGITSSLTPTLASTEPASRDVLPRKVTDEKDQVSSVLTEMVGTVIKRSLKVKKKVEANTPVLKLALHGTIREVIHRLDAAILRRRLEKQNPSDHDSRRSVQLHGELSIPKAIKDSSLKYDDLHNMPLHDMQADDLVLTDQGESFCSICHEIINGTKKFNFIRHFLSKKHMDCVDNRQITATSSSLCSSTTNLAQDLRFCASVAVSQSSMPFTSGTRILTYAQKVVSTIANGARIPDSEIFQARKIGCHNLADAAVRLNSLYDKKRVNQEPDQLPLLLSDRSVSRNVESAGSEVIQLIKQFLGGCAHFSLVLDESTTKLMKSSVVYVAVMAITRRFDWLMTFLFQKNVVRATSVQDYFDLVKNGVVEFGFWEQIGAAGTDGCHRMRSTRNYAGVHARGTEGDNFAAKLKSDLEARDPFIFHSVLHIIMLGLGDALDSLPSFWIQHIRAMTGYFSRSAQRKADLQDCYEQIMKELSELAELLRDQYELHDWALKYPSDYCPTRWTSLSTSADSLTEASLPLQRLKRDLIEGGFGPPLSMDDKEYEAGSSEANLLELDRTETGDANASKDMRSVILHHATGVTDANIGLDMMMSTLLTPFKVAQKQLQTTAQPIQHRVTRILSKMIRIYKAICNEDDEFDEPYAAWRRTMFIEAVSKQALVAAIDEIGKLFCRGLIDSLESRLEPYFPYYHAMAVIDPTAPAGPVASETWNAVRDICGRYGLSYDLVRRQLIHMHRDSVDLSRQDVALCRENLLRYYKTKSEMEQNDQEHLLAYSAVVFVLPFETVLVEDYFSDMNYNKSKQRASLKDESVANVIRTRAVHSVLEHPHLPFDRKLRLKTDSPLEHKLSF